MDTVPYPQELNLVTIVLLRITLYYIAFHCITLYCLSCIALYCLNCIALYYIVLHCITLYSIVFHCSPLYSIVIHCYPLYSMYAISKSFHYPSINQIKELVKFLPQDPGCQDCKIVYSGHTLHCIDFDYMMTAW